MLVMWLSAAYSISKAVNPARGAKDLHWWHKHLKMSPTRQKSSGKTFVHFHGSPATQVPENIAWHGCALERYIPVQKENQHHSCHIWGIVLNTTSIKHAAKEWNASNQQKHEGSQELSSPELILSDIQLTQAEQALHALKAVQGVATSAQVAQERQVTKTFQESGS
jgi:hypothetical protein